MVALLVLALLQGSPATLRTIGKGPTSDIESARQMVIRTPAEWQMVWQAHAPADRQLPTVDFAREIVLAVFLGQRPTAGYGVEIVRTINANGTLIVDYVETKPAPGAVAAQLITSPFHLVAVPKFDGDIKFQKTEK